MLIKFFPYVRLPVGTLHLHAWNQARASKPKRDPFGLWLEKLHNAAAVGVPPTATATGTAAAAATAFVRDSDMLSDKNYFICSVRGPTN